MREMADTPHETPDRTSLLEEEDWAPTKRTGEAVDSSEALAAFQALLSDYLASPAR